MSKTERSLSLGKQQSCSTGLVKCGCICLNTMLVIYCMQQHRLGKVESVRRVLFNNHGLDYSSNM